MKFLSNLFGLFSTLLLTATATIGVTADQGSSDQALRSLVVAERGFAAWAMQHGIRDAFLHHLADDSIVFAGGPANGKKLYEKYNDKGQHLIWEPRFATISRAGDLGCTSGPSTFKAADSAKESDFGEFVSIWQKRANDSWKVIVDLGIDHSAPTSPPGPIELVPANAQHTSVETASAALEDAKRALETAMKENAASAITTAASENIHLLRQDHFPAKGKTAAAKLVLDTGPAKLARQTQGGQISASTDLAYSYGSYSTENDSDGHGYFLSVWKLDPNGGWKLLIDVQKPVPPKS
jgi:ketosteroid isomerase-like protein